MGIPHLEDLPIHKLVKALNEPWTVSEKLDGSFMAFGLNSDGVFYTRRKTGAHCHHVNDWPDMPWCNSFRCAHGAAETVIAALQDQGVVTAPVEFECEVLWGQRPNTVSYTGAGNVSFLMLTGGDANLIREITDLFAGGIATVNTNIWHTRNGRELSKQPRQDAWICSGVQSFDLDMHLSRVAVDVLSWLNRPHEVWHEAKQLDMLEINLNRKPRWLPDNLWTQAHALLRGQLKSWRENARNELRWKVEAVKQATLAKAGRNHFSGSLSQHRRPREIEGVVCRTASGILFKVVPREEFSQANRYSHWVRYALQGGQRPARPSFMSRTRGWSVEQRLKRLDCLWRRYVNGRSRMHMTNQFYDVNYEKGSELDQRTLLLFAELRVRIRNGW